MPWISILLEPEDVKTVKVTEAHPGLTTIHEIIPMADTITENGAAAFSTTHSACLDLFFKLVRETEEEDVERLVAASWAELRDESPETTVKILLHGRDCRHGKGERRVVEYALKWLRRNKPNTYLLNLPSFIEVGYYRDLLKLCAAFEEAGQDKLGEKDFIELETLAACLKSDEETLLAREKEAVNIEEVKRPFTLTLAAKWAPTEGHAEDRKHQYAARLARLMYPQAAPVHGKKLYRQLLSKAREHLKVVERKMALNQWEVIEYGQVPSKAHRLLSKAFKRHDESGYMEYLEKVKRGAAKINSTGTQPHEIVSRFMHRHEAPDDEATLEAQWRDLVVKLKASGKLQRALAVSDVSGSMEGVPMEVSVALGLLISEVAEGPFHNKVMTFHSDPTLHQIGGETLNKRVRCLMRAPWGGSTNLQGTFDQILNHGTMFGVSQEQMPRVIVILSDMQFDEACEQSADDETIYQLARAKFEAAGYTLPNVVFWNLRATKESYPVTHTQSGTALVSGYSAELLKVFMDDPDNMTPMTIMHNTLQRYNAVIAEDERLLAPHELQAGREDSHSCR